MPKRTFHSVMALIGGMLVLAAPGLAQGQRVRPDPAVVQVLQDIQTAYDHKDTARYSQLLAGNLVGIMYGDTGEKVPMMEMSRDDIIKNFLGKADGDTLSPFIDATPVSKRVLYAETISGGQKVRVLLLNRPVPKVTQTVSWVMDLSVTRQGGQLMLTEMTLLPADLAKQVFWPMFNDLSKKNLPEGQAEKEAVALYNQYWAKFAADMPKPEAMPVGPSGTSRSLPQPSPAVKRPLAVPPPPPPRFVIPTRPTVYTPLPVPPPQILPPAQVTQRVLQLRTQIQNTVQQSFVAFVNRQISEQYFQNTGRRYYVNVYQNRFRVSYGVRTVIIVINLVFIQPPRGPMSTYFVPVIDNDPQSPPPPVPPQVIPQTPIVLPPPAAKSVGCMVLTDTAKLKAKHGPRFDEINRYLSSFGPIIDLAGANIRPGDAAAVDAILKKNFDRSTRDCLFIFGNHDVVPFATYPNPTYNKGGDPDPTVLSDDIYGDFDHDAHADPEIMVVRMPDDPGILADTNSVLYRPSATSQKIVLPDYAVYGNLHRSSPPLLAQLADPGKPNLLERSTPFTADNFTGDFFKGHNPLINLHGSDAASVAGAYWGEEPDAAGTQVVAMTADQATAPDGVVLCAACYGASIANVASDGTCVPKSSDTHIALRFLRNGASAFIGYTRVTWQAVAANALDEAEGMASKRFIELTRQGYSPQKSYQLIKREMAARVDRSSLQFAKMYREMVYLGLPPTGQRPVAPVATPDRPATIKTQLVRVMEQVRQAARQRNAASLVPLLMPTVRDGIDDGPDVDAQAMAQRIIDLMSQPQQPNPLSDASNIDESMFLVQKAPDSDYVASFRVQVNQNILSQPSGPTEPTDNVVRVKFRFDGSQAKISGWETKNKDFAQKVVQPQQQWVQQNNVNNPEEAKDKYQDLVEAYIDDAVSKASQTQTDATYAANPLAVTAAGGSIPTWAIVLLVAGGAVMITVVVLVLALRPRGGQAKPAGSTVILTCPQCGRQHSVGAGIAHMPMRCSCGASFQAPPAPMVAAPAMPLPVAPPPVVLQPIVLAAQAPPALAVVPQSERGGRSGRIIFFGLLLLASFFIPELAPGPSGDITAKFTNLVQLGDQNVPGLWKFLLAFPAGAAVLAILLALVTDWRWRGVVLAALPWVPAIVLATQKEGDVVDMMMAQSLIHLPWTMVVGLLGVLALWVGSRARRYRPGYGWLYAVTLAGVAGFVIWQFVPPGQGEVQSLRAADLIQALQAAATAEEKAIGGFWLAGYGLVALAGLLALCNVPGSRPSIRGLTNAAFWFVVIGVAVMLGCILVTRFQAIGQLKGWEAASEVLSLLKQWLLLVGMWLLFLGGLVDAIIGPAPRRAAQQGVAHK